MSKMRAINDSFWVDNWVSDLDRNEKYFFLYLMTNSHMSIAGVYQLPIKTIAFESEFSKNEVIEMFQKMKGKVSYIDGWVILRNYTKHQNYKNSKIKAGIESILLKLPARLFEYITLPNDFEFKAPELEKQASIFMGHEESSMTLEVLTPTLTSTSTPDSSKKSDGGKDFKGKEKMTPKQKFDYFQAMEREREQKKRAKAAQSRPRGEPSPFDDLREKVYKKKS